jgi:hypothetical protein
LGPGNTLNVKEYYSVHEITRLGSLLPKTKLINQDNKGDGYIQ